MQEARKQLEEQQDELRALMTKLEADRNMELDERQKLEEEIRKKQEVLKEFVIHFFKRKIREINISFLIGN